MRAVVTVRSDNSQSVRDLFHTNLLTYLLTIHEVDHVIYCAYSPFRRPTKRLQPTTPSRRRSPPLI